MNWQEIEGWLTPEEGAALASLAKDKIVLELGSFKGRSTVCMAEVAHHVVTVDWHGGDADGVPAGSFPDLEKNIQASGVKGVALVNKRFEELDDFFLKAHRFDLVFVDGQHDAASVKRDAEIAKRTGASVIAFHDATYPSVQEGARAAGFNLRFVGGSVAVGVPAPKVVIVQPRYGPNAIWPEADRSFWNRPTLGTCDIAARLQHSQSICYVFNQLLAEALDMRDRGEADHIAMIHADVAAPDGWLDTLYQELYAEKADIVSAVIAIKDDVPNPRTSTAIGDHWNEWFPKRFIHEQDRGRMPETFGPEHVCEADEILLLNTGLWLAPLNRPWWDYFGWSLDSRITRHNGKRIVQMRPEDWQMSRFLHGHGAKMRATWKVPIKHYGEATWATGGPR
jgi:hypothetical protein